MQGVMEEITETLNIPYYKENLEPYQEVITTPQTVKGT